MDIGGLLNSAWSKYSKNLGMCIAVYFVGALIGGALSWIVIGIPIIAGAWKGMRKAQRGETPDFNDLFSEFSNMGKWVMVWVIMLAMGIIACIPVLGWIAVIIFGFGLAFLFPLMLDRNMAAFEAAKLSFNTVKANLGTLILPILVFGIIGGIFAPVTGPFMAIGMWEIYDQTTFAD
jgi:hypothetical protein